MYSRREGKTKSHSDSAISEVFSVNHSISSKTCAQKLEAKNYYNNVINGLNMRFK